MNIVDEILDKLNCLNLSIKNTYLSKKIILMAINSTESFIKYEINPFIDFSLIKNIFIDIVIGEYLSLIKSSGLQNDISLNEAIKSIKEGDTSITYFENNENSFDSIIKYFLNKKMLLNNFKKVVW